MAYVPVPKDLTKVKTKVALNLTKRQIICFSVALLLGLPLFFLLKDSAGTSLAAFVMIGYASKAAVLRNQGRRFHFQIRNAEGVLKSPFFRNTAVS